MKILGRRKDARLAEMKKRRDVLSAALAELVIAGASVATVHLWLGEKETKDIMSRLSKLQDRYSAELADLLSKT